MDPSHEHIPPTLFSASPFIPATVDGIMTELSFAKSYLSLLDSRPVKLQPDHVSPAQNLEITASYTLPRMAEPMRKPGTTPADSKAVDATVTIRLKSSRNPALSLSLSGMDTGVSILELKERVAKAIKTENTDKIRLLYARKPCSDSKTVKEVMGDEAVEEVEFGVMVMGYTASNLKKEGADGAARTEEGTKTDEGASGPRGPSGEDVLSGREFWDDLRGFLVQRLRDEKTAGELLEKFRGSWQGR